MTELYFIMYITHFIYPVTGLCPYWFHIFVIVSWVSINMGVKVALSNADFISFVRILDLLLVSWGGSILFSIMIAIIYILTYSVLGFPFLYSLTSCCLFMASSCFLTGLFIYFVAVEFLEQLIYSGYQSYQMQLANIFCLFCWLSLHFVVSFVGKKCFGLQKNLFLFLFSLLLGYYPNIIVCVSRVFVYAFL